MVYVVGASCGAELLEQVADRLLKRIKGAFGVVAQHGMGLPRGSGTRTLGAEGLRLLPGIAQEHRCPAADQAGRQCLHIPPQRVRRAGHGRIGRE